MLSALLVAAALVPAHVLSWYYYGLAGVNVDVPAATMARYADFAEDEGHAAEHAMAFKRAGGRYAVAYTDPAYVPYCHAPFSPPAGHCEGPIGDLTTSESAWLHGPDGARIHKYVDKEYDHQEALNPASSDARHAWRLKTENVLRRAPAVDLLFADDAGGPYGTWFYGFNARAVEIPEAQTFLASWISYLSLSRLPLIVNGYDDATGLPSYGGAIVAQPFVRGEARENCFSGEADGIKTDRGDKWRYHADGLLAVTAMQRYAVCLMQGKPALHARLYALASWWTTYDPHWSVAGPIWQGEHTLLPELDIVPTEPLRSAARSIAVLRTPGGAYVREFRACYQRRAALGPCAALVNPSAHPVPVPALAQHYGRALALEGGDVLAGGRAQWAAGPPHMLEPESAAILAR